MQILQNGQVQITNNQTGETRVVDPSQLSAFSPLLANQYYNAMAESRANAKAHSVGTSSDLLKPPAVGQMPTMPTNQNAPDLSGLHRFAQPIKPAAPKVIISGLSGNSGIGGAQLTPMTSPVQYSPQAKPQQPQGLSTFDITKSGF